MRARAAGERRGLGGRILDLGALVAVALTAILSVAPSRSASAQPQGMLTAAAPRVVDPAPVPGSVPAAAGPARAAARADQVAAPGVQRSTFQVTYVNQQPTDEQRAAFQRAVDIWDDRIVSSVPIRVEVSFAPQPGNSLAAAGPNFVRANFPNAPLADTFYPDALADALARQDLGPQDGPDIFVEVNSTFSAFHYGEGPPAGNQVDFVSVALHELGHGLGFLGAAVVDTTGTAAPGDDSGAVGIDVDDGPGFLQVPIIYDQFTETTGGTDLFDGFDNPSNALAQALRNDDDVTFGPQATAANGGVRPELFVPNPFQQGSSYSHWDEPYYPPGNPNALMTPQIGFGEVARDPGPVQMGLFRDLGYADPAAVEPTPSPGPTSTSSDVPSEAPAPTPAPDPVVPEAGSPTALPVIAVGLVVASFAARRLGHSRA